MAAYAAVASLMGTIHLISQSSLDFQVSHKEHLNLLYEKVSYLQELLDNIHDDKATKVLQAKVKDLAHEAEDQVESQVQLVMEKDEQVRTEASERLLEILKKAIQDMDAVKEELIKLMESNDLHAANPSRSGSSSPQSYVSTLENNMVGYTIEQGRLRDQLTIHSSQLEVISIAGMGGIGKSTFAKKMFTDPSIMRFFDVRGWITLSKDYTSRNVLLTLLQDAIGVNKEDLGNESYEDLADLLQKSLKGRRYLIVVDDIWSTEAWDDFRQCFPENSNKSRILLTTRDITVAQYASSPEDLFRMRFLTAEESWNLFNQKAFGKKACPIEFQNVAKEVVDNCKGLPLMISVVAGTLSSKRTLDEWREVAQNVSSSVNLDDYQHCSGVLALSYNHLPSHLKSCFLYFGVFPKASEISMKKLIRLWVADGLILELKGFKGLENVAANLLQELIDKSLVVVSKRSLDNKIKSCRIHDLLHDLCLREAESSSLFYAVNPLNAFPQGRRWVSVQSKVGCFSPILFDDLTYSKTRSIFYSSIETTSRDIGLVHFKLLRVLDLVTMALGDFPAEILHIVSLRYLALKVSGIPKDLPISNLWNLQTFILGDYENEPTVLPKGIWEMSQLRHLHFRRMYLHAPPKYQLTNTSTGFWKTCKLFLG